MYAMEHVRTRDLTLRPYEITRTQYVLYHLNNAIGKTWWRFLSIPTGWLVSKNRWVAPWAYSRFEVPMYSSYVHVSRAQIGAQKKINPQPFQDGRPLADAEAEASSGSSTGVDQPEHAHERREESTTPIPVLHPLLGDLLKPVIFSPSKCLHSSLGPITSLRKITEMGWKVSVVTTPPTTPTVNQMTMVWNPKEACKCSAQKPTFHVDTWEATLPKGNGLFKSKELAIRGDTPSTEKERSSTPPERMLVSRLKRFYNTTGEQLHPTVTRKQFRVRATHPSAHVTDWPVKELLDKFLLTPQME
jgi:hypothetical protein